MRKESISRKCFNVFNVLFMICLVIVMVFPYIHILAKSLNDGADTARGGIVLLPREFTLENFKAVILDKAFPRAVLVSVLRVVIGTVLAVVVQFLAAYVFTHKDLVGRKGLLVFFMIPMYFGGGLVPTYIMYSKLGLINNPLLYVVPGCFSLYNMVIIRTYMNSLPASLCEAAEIDGAGELTILAKIVAPLCKPIMMTIALFHKEKTVHAAVFACTGSEGNRKDTAHDRRSNAAWRYALKSSVYSDNRFCSMRSNHYHHNSDHTGVPVYSEIFHQWRNTGCSQRLNSSGPQNHMLITESV